MAETKECGKSIKAWEALGGACEDCYSLHLQNKARLKQKEDATERELAQQRLAQRYVCQCQKPSRWSLSRS